MPDLKRATEDIERAVHEFEARRARDHRFRRQLAATDELLELLERMNLQEVEFLGAAAARRAARALETLPAPLRPTIGPRTRVQRALDQVFDVQEALFAVHPRSHRPVAVAERALSA